MPAAVGEADEGLTKTLGDNYSQWHLPKGNIGEAAEAGLFALDNVYRALLTKTSEVRIWQQI
jgi:hypothetical protein